MTFPESTRDALPRTETYPCGREALDAALSNAGVQSVDLVYFLRAGIEDWEAGDAVLLNVDFRASTRDRSERIEIRVHAIPSQRNRAVEAALPKALARIAEWIRRAELAENVWRSSDHEIVARWHGEDVVTSDR